MERTLVLAPGFVALLELGDGADGPALLWRRQLALDRHTFEGEAFDLGYQDKPPSILNIVRHFGGWEWRWCVVMVVNVTVCLLDCLL